MGIYIPNITLEQLKNPNNLYIVVEGQPFVKRDVIAIPTPHGPLIDGDKLRERMGEALGIDGIWLNENTGFDPDLIMIGKEV